MDTASAPKFVKTEYRGCYVSKCGLYRVIPEFSTLYSKTVTGYRCQRLSDKKIVAEAGTLKTLSARVAGTSAQ